VTSVFSLFSATENTEKKTFTAQQRLTDQRCSAPSRAFDYCFSIRGAGVHARCQPGRCQPGCQSGNTVVHWDRRVMEVSS
jgi:hypothetical protein